MADNNGFGAIRSVDYIIILCDDLDVMRRFYVETMGLRLHDEDPGVWVGLEVGNLFIGLRPRGRAYDGPVIDESSASIQLSFCVPPADVDAAYATLQEGGIDVIEGPTNQDWTHRTLFFHDPENNIIEIYADIHPRDTASAPSGVHALETD